jgi:hypothetical protein
MMERFKADLTTGRLLWIRPPWNHPRLRGQEAGHARPSCNGRFYWIIQVDGEKHRRSHLIFRIVHGRWPRREIDHVDGNSLNDRPDNLREATHTENAWNHGIFKRRIPLPLGVRHTPSSGRYQARISFHGVQLHLGAFSTPTEAHQVYLAKRKELYGEFARNP